VALFFGLVLAARYRESGQPNWVLDLFFYIDPLILIATWLSAHSVPFLAFLALITLAVTPLLGRVFCGWVCPLGTLNAAAGWLMRLGRENSVAPDKETWSPRQRVKYYLLIGLIVMAVFGVHWIGVFDPIALLYRTTATALLPATQYAIEDSATAIYHTDPHIGSVHLTSFTEPVYRFFRDRVFVRPRQSFEGSTLILFLFAAIILLNLYRKRFWCRYLCPLGALLGLAAWRPLLRLVRNQEECTACGRCTTSCQGAAARTEHGEWVAQECFGCWNCVAACNWNGLRFRFGAPLQTVGTAKLDLSRRAMVGALAGGLSSVLLFRLTPQAQGRTYNPVLIRPPGAREEREFLQRCIQCGLCMKVCPTGGLQPTLIEAGIEGLWSPKLVPKVGYCEYECNLCGQVCPTEAIQPLPLEEKKEVKIGLAVIDTTRCIPYAFDRNCIVCEEHCPIPDKAIYFVTQEVTTRDGKTMVLKQPRVDPDLCIGCGICETKCPFKDRAAIRVTSANESRHPRNRVILPGQRKRARHGFGGMDASRGRRRAGLGLSTSSPEQTPSDPYSP
jgi:polyferredoxin